jgi:3-deoxy-D-manno-octulosonate 8-phosphate phosphatase (KDO 8-P phosphatase)
MNPVKAIVLDVDGVLTDGGVWWGPNGEEWKRFSFADIMGVSLARKAGLMVGLIQDGHHRGREGLQAQGPGAA